MVVALGHGKLRRKIVSMMQRWFEAIKCHGGNNAHGGGSRKIAETSGKQIVFNVPEERKVVQVVPADKAKKRREEIGIDWIILRNKD